MDQAIYFVANDLVYDQAIALVKSIRSCDSEIPLILIPYDHRYEQVANALSTDFGVMLFPDLQLLNQLDSLLAAKLKRFRLTYPQRLRNIASWFGPVKRFLCVDADIVVFRRIADILTNLSDADFVCCDFQFKNGLRHVFHERARRTGLISESVASDVFNGGFFASTKGALSWESLSLRLEQCGRLRGVLDFSGGGCAQPILNYIVLTELPRRINLAKSGVEPGNWAGSPHFRRVGQVLYDGSTPLRYLHWAGLSINPDAPYWEMWQHYRHLAYSRCS